LGPGTPPGGSGGAPTRGRMGFPPERPFPSLIVRNISENVTQISKKLENLPKVSTNFPKNWKMPALFPPHGIKNGLKNGFPYRVFPISVLRRCSAGATILPPISDLRSPRVIQNGGEASRVMHLSITSLRGSQYYGRLGLNGSNGITLITHFATQLSTSRFSNCPSQ
jgi:hypothetical protein